LAQLSRRGTLAAMHNVVIFVHIPKCGGTTFNEVLRSIYGDGALVHAEVSEDFLGKSEADLARYAAVSSHFRYGYGMHERFGRPGIYLSLVRDPLENFVSFFNDITNRPSHFLYAQVKDLDIEQFFRFLDDRDHPAVRNRQCLHLCNSSDYLLAREYAERRYAIVGPLEEFDEFVRRFCALVDKPVPRYEPANVSMKKITADVLPFAFKCRFYTYNSADLRLYHFVRERFFLTPA
jgi:hypothetical protein